MIIRLAKKADLNALVGLSKKTASGMTTVPQDAEGWDRLICATEQFNSLQKKEGHCLFVLEDTKKGAIAGFTAIHRNVGLTRPFFSFKKSKIQKANSITGRTTSYEILFLTNDFGHADEIGTLFLDPAYQGQGIGRFLSLSRFLFMALETDRYSSVIFAEMRGFQNEKGVSPVWEALGKHFFDIPFEEADRFSAEKPVQFITDSFPDHPIIVDLLPTEAQAAIGKPHDKTIPAYKLLKSIGFIDMNYVDIFDGGPTLYTPIENIRPLRDSQSRLAKIGNPEGDPTHMIAKSDPANFATSISSVSLEDDIAVISEEAAKKLHIRDGEPIILSALR
ncbi:MAG: arginine N-succinyltransferase [Kordiimonadaceae bacterium]|nr:arginine N-succinyltransferase [Kordiimonadaceae bacterium]